MSDFDAWLEHGISQKWVLPAVCSTHDGLPMTPDETEQFDSGGDPCVHVLRLCESAQIYDESILDIPPHRK